MSTSLGTRAIVVAVLFSSLGVGGCVIRQTARPASVATGAEICIIEDPPVRSGFLATVKQALTQRGYRYRMLPPHASVGDCETVLTYVGRWGWDFTIYMTYAKLDLYRNGHLAGDAVYDARKGGGRPDKWIDAEPKIDELVASLLSGTGAVNSNESSIGAASLASVPIETMCMHASKVDQAECIGRLDLGMTRDQVLQVLGTPTSKSADELTLRYDDRYLVFDSGRRLVEIRESKVE